MLSGTIVRRHLSEICAPLHLASAHHDRIHYVVRIPLLARMRVRVRAGFLVRIDANWRCFDTQLAS